MCSAQKPTLVIMAAGMGSRFGGLKQLTPVGPNNELIIDYSIHDALAAGFGKVVFVIKHAIEDAFKAEIGNRIAQYAPVEYVYQELDKLPAGFTVPDGREKPWGTGHAILCCQEVVDAPFAVINADDYYGIECFQKLAAFLKTPQPEHKKRFAMAGYRLINTLTENGSVSRGVCQVDENSMLIRLDERTRIELKDGQPMYTEDGGDSWIALAENCPVSMNCWAFPAGTISLLKDLFVDFLNQKGTEMKSEFYLPMAVNDLMDADVAEVVVLPTADKWYGMTYSADLPSVRTALAEMARNGTYAAKLWDK